MDTLVSVSRLRRQVQGQGHQGDKGSRGMNSVKSDAGNFVWGTSFDRQPVELCGSWHGVCTPGDRMSYKDRPIQQHTCCDFLLAKHKFLCCPPSHGYIHLGLQLANVLAVHLFVLDERRLKTIDTTTVHSEKVNFGYDDDDFCFYIALFPTSWTKMETIQIFYCIHAVWEGELMQSLSHTQTLKSPDHHNMTGIHQSPA